MAVSLGRDAEGVKLDERRPRPRLAHPITARPSCWGRWRTLGAVGLAMMFHDKAKLVGTLFGVVFAVVLGNFQTGMFLALLHKNRRFGENTPVDVWIAPPRTRQFLSASPLTDSELNRPRATEGVEGTRAPRFAGGPWNLVAGTTDALRQPNAMTFEDGEREKFGGLNLGSVREVGGQQVHVGGFAWGLLPFAPAYAFAELDLAQTTAKFPTDPYSCVLVKVAPEATPAVVRDRLPVAMPNTRVLTQDEYLGEMLTCVLKEMQTVLTFATSTLMSLLVGRITVALSMFSAVVDTLRQVETIKAIGATNGDLAKLLLVQAVTSGVLAFQALRGIGLEVREGEFRMLVGPSGSGKTTLLSILGCVLTPTTGRAWPFDEPLHGRPEAELPELLTRRRPPLVGFTHLLDTCGVQIIRGALAEPVTVPLSTDVRRAGREAKSRVDGLDEKRPLESLGAHWVGGNGVVEIARRFGWKNIRSDGPVEKNDTKVLETVIELDSNALLIPGQRVTCFVAAAPDAT